MAGGQDARGEGDEADRVVPADYQELCKLAWNRDANRPIGGAEALQLYEAAWRHVNEAAMTSRERDLVRRLADRHGNGILLARR